MAKRPMRYITDSIEAGQVAHTELEFRTKINDDFSSTSFTIERMADLPGGAETKVWLGQRNRTRGVAVPCWASEAPDEANGEEPIVWVAVYEDGTVTHD